ncbi:YciI family protein [Bartonella sp. HY761]|uniref:YciI family protein n=1 Tax=Bartonella sp. HY761 TaxID=2979330 RepID=UPI0022027D02|nr:YciI family protein [Bartonella sp. HY761]UXN06824.1 YciI family protein [Bartonella sp. HY761]
MLYAIIANDKPDHVEKRQEVRPKHLEYLTSLGDTLKFAGPFLDHEGNGVGSLLVVEAVDIAEAEKIMKNDPYALANLFADAQVRPWRWAINNPENS